jgi:hypothetical protein
VNHKNKMKTLVYTKCPLYLDSPIITEAEVNDRLIAAAPDLLAALESIAVGLSPASVEMQRENLAQLCQVCREIAENALAKAKGGGA